MPAAPNRLKRPGYQLLALARAPVMYVVMHVVLPLYLRLVRGNGREIAELLVDFSWQSGQRGNWQLARRWARGAVDADPTWAEGYRLLGFSYMKNGAPAVARAMLEDRVTIDPNQAEAHAWLGELALDREDWEAASE